MAESFVPVRALIVSSLNGEGTLSRPLHNRDLVKQVRTPPVRPADGVVGCVYESFVPEEDCCGLGLRAKIKSAEHTPAL